MEKHAAKWVVGWQARGLVSGALGAAALALGACAGSSPQAAAAPAPSAEPPAPVASVPPPAPADTTPPPPPKPSLGELIPRTLLGIGAAFNAHDAGAVAGFFTEDAAVSAYGAPEAHGRDAIVKSMQGIFGTFGDLKSAATRVWIKDDVAIAETVWAGTMTGDFMGMKATKKAAGQFRVDVMWFDENGLVKEMHEYGDDAGLLAQMKGTKGAPPVPVVPSNPPAVHLAKGSPDEDKLADWARGSDASMGRDDAKAVVATMADDGDYWNNFSGNPAVQGKKDLSKDIEGFFKAFPDQKWATSHAWGIDGFGIVEHALSGTQKGKLGPLPASNKPVKDWHWLDIMVPTADGRLQHGWGYANLVEMMTQTGALKAPRPQAPKVESAKADAPKDDAEKK